jgi:hypothetical protein
MKARLRTVTTEVTTAAIWIIIILGTATAVIVIAAIVTAVIVIRVIRPIDI